MKIYGSSHKSAGSYALEPMQLHQNHSSFRINLKSAWRML